MWCTFWFIDGNLIRLNEITSEKGIKTNDDCDPSRSDSSPSRYQHLREADTSFTSKYVVQMPSDAGNLKWKPSRQNENSSLMFENCTLDDARSRPSQRANSTKRYFSPQTLVRNSLYVRGMTSPGRCGFQATNNAIRPAFVTPPRSRHAVNGDSGRNLYRSLSIDSNFDAARINQFDDVQQYNQLQISPFASPKKAKPTSIRDPNNEARSNFITNTKTLSPKVRGSFVWMIASKVKEETTSSPMISVIFSPNCDFEMCRYWMFLPSLQSSKFAFQYDILRRLHQLIIK